MTRVTVGPGYASPESPAGQRPNLGLRTTDGTKLIITPHTHHLAGFGDQKIYLAMLAGAGALERWVRECLRPSAPG
jgi:hypothetical protein